MITGGPARPQVDPTGPGPDEDPPVDCARPTSLEQRRRCDAAATETGDAVARAAQQGALGGGQSVVGQSETNDAVADAAERVFARHFGACPEFRPAFVRGVDPDRTFTNRQYVTSLGRAYEACGVANPPVTVHFPAQRDPVDGAVTSLGASTQRLVRDCATGPDGGAEMLCEAGAQQLPMVIARALVNGQDVGDDDGLEESAPAAGSNVNPDSRTFGLATRIAARAEEIHQERNDEHCAEPLRWISRTSCFSGGPEPDVGGVYDRAALAQAAREVAEEQGYSGADAARIEEWITDAPWA